MSYTKEDGSQPIAPRRFLPAFGKAALTLGGASFVFCCVFGGVIRSLAGIQDVDPAIVRGSSIVALISCGVIGISAVVLGVLALFGVGKVDGKSHRLAGAIGAVAGALMTAILVIALLAAANVRSRIDAETEKWPFVDQATGLTLRRPGPAWLIKTGKDAEAAHPLAVAAAIDPSGGEAHFRILFVQVESLEGLDSGQVDLLELGERLADASLLENKRLEVVQPTEVGGLRGVRFSVVGSANGRRVRQFYASVIRDGSAIGIVFIGAESDPHVNASEFDFILSHADFRDL